jgi:hypothetical protein
MVPPDAVRARRLPAMTWDSIVDDRQRHEVDGDGNPPLLGGDPPAPDPLTFEPPAAVPVRVDPPEIAPLTLGRLPVPEPVRGPRPDAPLAAPPPMRPPSALQPAVPPQAAEPANEAAGPLLRNTPTGVVTTDVPQIVEATPPPDLGPVLPMDQPLALPGPSTEGLYRLPDVARVAPAASSVIAEQPAAHFVPAPQQRRRRRGGGVVKLVVTLAVVGGLVAAGVLFGQPYFFPDDTWDTATEPYATTVEAVRAVEYTEPLTVISEPTATYSTRMTGQLTGDWSSEQPLWRALGLLNGEANATNVGELLAGWQDAMYSHADGQVYRDAAATGPQADAEVTQAMVAALLDQQFGWTARQPSRTLDGAASTTAQVLRQSRATQAASTFPADVRQRDTAPLVFLPPVLGYRILAPLVFAEFTGPDQAGGNPLQDVGSAGPGPLGTVSPLPANGPMLVPGDQIATSPLPMDRSFWYLVFAGYLDATVAHAASEAVVENSVVVAERPGGRCVYATFSGGDITQTSTVRAALESWSASVPPEFGSSFGVLPDGTLQLLTCDPGAGFENGSRLGVARELVGWRTAQLATIEAVVAAGGGPAELAEALERVSASGVGAELALLPLDATPADAAGSARSAVAAVLAS